MIQHVSALLPDFPQGQQPEQQVELWTKLLCTRAQLSIISRLSDRVYPERERGREGEREEGREGEKERERERGRKGGREGERWPCASTHLSFKSYSTSKSTLKYLLRYEEVNS